MFIKRSKYFGYNIYLQLLIIIALVFPFQARAAGAIFGIAPDNGTFKVGNTITAQVYINTEDAINAAEAVLNFPVDILRVKSISKTGSIFSLWPLEPAFDNNKGIISFAGGTTASFKGNNGFVLRVEFIALHGSQGVLKFNGARILQADGNGSDIFAGAQSAKWEILFQEPLKKGVKKLPPTLILPVAAPLPSTTTPPQEEISDFVTSTQVVGVRRLELWPLLTVLLIIGGLWFITWIISRYFRRK